MIDARALHGWLGVSDPFSQWIKRRVKEYGFEEGVDFFTELLKTRGRPRKEYLLTLDTAKELAMVERTEIGREYFARNPILKCAGLWFVGAHDEPVETAFGDGFHRTTGGHAKVRSWH